jgi:hypothetical protein
MNDSKKPVMRRDGDEFDAMNGTPVDLQTLMMRPGPPFSWHDVEQGLTDRAIMSRTVDDEMALCQFCGQAMKVSWWASSPDTWSALAGRAGVLSFCRDCQAWYPVHEVIIS